MDAAAVLKASVAFLGLLAATVLATWGVQELTGQHKDDVLLTAGVLVSEGTLLVLWDWRWLGPTVALHSSSLAAAAAWLLVVPLGLMGLELVETVRMVGFLVLGLAVTLSVGLAFGHFIPGVVAGVVLLYSSNKADSVVVDAAGTVALYAAIFAVVRKAITLRRIHHWPETEELDPSSQEFREQRKMFEDACVPWAHKYDFRLTVDRIYRMQGAKHRVRWANARKLFHGTPWEAARELPGAAAMRGPADPALRGSLAALRSGFPSSLLCAEENRRARWLPRHPGMFGKGIYFADCPLKSWQYTRNLGEEVMCCRRGGLILMCLVDLGLERREAQANTGLTGYNRHGWWAWLTLQYGAYDSVVGLEHTQGGALRVPEYVIYDPNHARVEYIYEVSKCGLGLIGE